MCSAEERISKAEMLYQYTARWGEGLERFQSHGEPSGFCPEEVRQCLLVCT